MFLGKPMPDDQCFSLALDFNRCLLFKEFVLLHFAIPQYMIVFSKT